MSHAMRVAVYEQVMEAQDRIAQVLYRWGITNAAILDALDTADERLSGDERRQDLYLSMLTHYVEALGGRLEVRAVFGDEAVVLASRPDPAP
ncbi:MAG TPA: hypothetical protein VHX62_10685 [Solirubrobacteraceae bacterium]|nr:hypothetical protein [Solirubrobacteraceae bacterium]